MTRKADLSVGITRRTLLGSALALPVAAAGCAEDEPARPGAGRLRKLTVLTGYGLLGQDAYLLTAAAKGFFDDAGIELDLKPGTGTGQNLKILAAGKADVATIDLSGGLQAYADGVQGFTVFAAVYQRTVSCVMVKADAGISTPRDLAGKSIAYTPGGVNYTLFPTYARLAGLDASRIRWVTANPSNLRALLAAGRVHGITETVIGKAGTEAVTGTPVTVLPYSDYLTDLYGNALATSRAIADREPDLVRRFRAAALKGLAYALDHPDEAGRILHRHNPAYPAAVAAAETRLMDPYVRPANAAAIGTLDPARVARSIAILQGASALPKTVTIEPPDVVSFDLAATSTTTPA
jgi:NitT/TauT family transport system substrate-binding protein